MATITVVQKIFSWFGLLGWLEISAALMVALGCLGELWIVLNKLTRHIHEFGKTSSRIWKFLSWIDARLRPVFVRLKINGRKLPEYKEELLERFCVALITLGVGLELIVLPFELHEVATLNERAYSNEVQVQNLISTNLVLTTNIAGLNLQVAAAQKEAANAQAVATQLKMDFYPRMLRTDVPLYYNVVFDRVSVEIEYADDPTGESESLAQSIPSLIQRSPAAHVSVSKFSPAGAPGIVIFVHLPDKDPVPPDGIELKSWMERTGNPTKSEILNAASYIADLLHRSEIEAKITNVTTGPPVRVHIGPRIVFNREAGVIDRPE